MLYRWSPGDGTPAHRQGLEVLGVTIGSPAYQAGIRHGDRIVAVDGRPITDPDIASRLAAGKPGEHWIPIEVARDGKLRTLAVLSSSR
jgi:S1-C subfamily serine protease